MDAVEERVAYVEGRVEEQGNVLTEMRATMASLEDRMDRRFEGVDRRLDGIDRRLDRMDDKMTRLFLWQVGIQITTLTATLGALAAALLTR